MKSGFLCALLLIATASFSQDGKKQNSGRAFGIRAGLNFPMIKNVSAVKASNSNGYTVGGFMAFKSKKIIGYRSEIVYSRIGYDFTSTTAKGNVHLDYIYLPVLTTVNVTKYVQFQFGPQAIFLLNAKADSSSAVSTPVSNKKLSNYYKPLDYGFTGGVEIYPVRQVLIGFRYNFNFGELLSKTAGINGYPTGVGGMDPKRHVVQLFAGVRL